VFINLPNQDSANDLLDCVREELVQQLGFFNDGNIPESCFYQKENEILKFSEIDVKLINMLYND
jgi:hypothetical protein